MEPPPFIGFVAGRQRVAAAPVPVRRGSRHRRKSQTPLRVDSAAQRLAIAEFLDVAQPRRDAAVAVGVEAVERHRDLPVAAGVHFALVEDGLHLPVHHLRGLTAVGVEEPAVRVGFVVRALDVAVAQGQLQVRGDLATPFGEGFLLGILYGCPDLLHGPCVALGDDGRDAVAGIAAVDRVRLPAVQVGKAAGDDDFVGIHTHGSNLLNLRVQIVLWTICTYTRRIYNSLSLVGAEAPPSEIVLCGVKGNGFTPVGVGDEGELTLGLVDELSEDGAEALFAHEPLHLGHAQQGLFVDVRVPGGCGGPGDVLLGRVSPALRPSTTL